VKLLAFDTSTEALAIAVRAPSGAFTLDAPGGAAASATLLPQAHALLARAGIALVELDAIAFGRGPGAFTGLRTSCAVAQGLAFGLARPVLPIDSLLVVAEDARERFALEDGEVVVAMDARMDEVYAARYAWSADGTWTVRVPPALYTLEAFAARLAASPARVLAGSAIEAFGARLVHPAQAVLVPAPQARAAALLRLAERAHAAGAGVDAAEALPLYLRDKVALTTAERAERAERAEPRPQAARRP